MCHLLAGQRGMFTAEFAVGLMAVIPVMGALLMLIGAGAVHVKLVEAARTAARVLARGESPTDAKQRVTQIVPGAQMSIDRTGDMVTVRVDKVLKVPGLLPDMPMHAQMTTPMEVDDAL